MRHKRMRFAVVAMTALATLGATTATAQPAAASSTQVAQAVQGVGDLLAPLAASQADADSAAQTSAVDVRRNGRLAFSTPDAGNIVITLPYAGSAAQRVDGGVAFAGKGGNGSFVRPSPGGAQVMLVAVNKSAPTQYQFGVQNGSVAPGPNGGLLLFDRKHRLNRIIPAPWARDAARQAVPTRYMASPDGSSFSQMVEHRAAGVRYPVVADPIWIPGWVLIACGAGWALGSIGYWIAGGTDARQAFGAAAVGCISWILGKMI